MSEERTVHPCGCGAPVAPGGARSRRAVWSVEMHYALRWEERKRTRPGGHLFLCGLDQNPYAIRGTARTGGAGVTKGRELSDSSKRREIVRLRAGRELRLPRLRRESMGTQNFQRRQRPAVPRSEVQREGPRTASEVRKARKFSTGSGFVSRPSTDEISRGGAVESVRKAE